MINIYPPRFYNISWGRFSKKGDILRIERLSPFLDTNCVVKYRDPNTIECLSIRRMSKMSLIWGTISSSEDDVIIYIFLDCSAQFILKKKKRMLKADWETPAQRKLSFIHCFRKFTDAVSTDRPGMS